MARQRRPAGGGAQGHVRVVVRGAVLLGSFDRRAAIAAWPPPRPRRPVRVHRVGGEDRARRELGAVAHLRKHVPAASPEARRSGNRERGVGEAWHRCDRPQDHLVLGRRLGGAGPRPRAREPLLGQHARQGHLLRDAQRLLALRLSPRRARPARRGQRLHRAPCGRARRGP